MVKYLFLALLFPFGAYAGDFVFTVSNPMMAATAANSAEINITGIDPFSPSTHCASFSSPNVCDVQGNQIVWTLVFDYDLVMNVAGTVDVDFVVNNGVGGDGAFTIDSYPSSLMGLGNGANGSFTYGLRFPYFSSHLVYSMSVDLDLTYNP